MPRSSSASPPRKRKRVQKQSAISVLARAQAKEQQAPVCNLDGISLTLYNGNRAPGSVRLWMLSCIESSLSKGYASSGVGWSASEKRRELSSSEQRLCIASAEEAAGTDIGFVSFRYDIEDEEVVAYIYDIFVEKEWRGKSIASTLVKVVEKLATDVGIPKIMLTVFSDNEPAMKMYLNKLSFSLDESSPSNYPDEPLLAEAKYEILSKKL